MSSKLQITLVHVVVSLGLLVGFLTMPAPPAPDGDCSMQTATCTG